jgi:thymidylate synthase ThyX
MPIAAKMILDSISQEGHRLRTFQITCHRWILAEINTHRALSRNYRSSRAVPFTKLLAEVRHNTAMPVAWLKNKPGMVATEPMTPDEEKLARQEWEWAASSAADWAEAVGKTGLHKQWVNRLLEPYLFVHGVISGTDFANFYHLRRAADAQPEFKALTDAMWEAEQTSTPTLLTAGQWHLPYVDASDEAVFRHLSPLGCNAELRKLSVARIARVSVKPHDSDSVDTDKDLALHGKLLKDRHMSPFEHQATPDSLALYRRTAGLCWMTPALHGNFTGWCQYRKMIPGEYMPEVC